MDYRSLVNKLEAIQAGTYISEATAPTEFKPTHFHKGNLGNKMPLMQTPDGAFWWEGGNQGGEGPMTGSRITVWNGDTLNRSGWNPASVDGVITPDGKYIDFPEGVNWKQYKETADADAALVEMLKKLMELIEKYNALRAKRGQGGKSAVSATQDMGDGSKLTVDPKTGVAAATNDDGTPYVPGSNPNLPKNKVKESVNFKGSIAQSLVESFGYTLYEQDIINPEAPGYLQTKLNVKGTDTPTFDPNQKYRDMYARQDTAANAKAYTDAEQKMLQQQRAAQTTAPKNFSQTSSVKYNVPTSNVPNMPSFSTGAPTTAGVTTAATTVPAGTTAPAANAGAKATAGAGSKMLGAGSKLLGRAMPGVGAYMGATSAIDSYKKGDYLGAALNGLSGAFSLVPGLGWIPAVGLGAWQAGRELSGATDKYDNPENTVDPKTGKPATQSGQPNPPGAGPVDPKVKALQQRILAKDPNALPKYGADGRMGAETQAAMQRLKIQENTMPQKSLAETMRELQQKLDNINEADDESQAPAADIKPIPATADELATAEMAEKVGGHIEKMGDKVVVVTKDNQIVDPTTKEILTNTGSELAGTGEMFEPSMAEGYDELEEGFWDGLLKGAAKLGRSASVVGRRTARLNPGKTALGVGGAALAGGYASGSAGSTPTSPTSPTAPVTPPAGGGSSGGAGQTNPPDTTAADDAEMAALKKQIEEIMAKLSTSKNPEIQAGLAAAKEKLK